MPKGQAKGVDGRSKFYKDFLAVEQSGKIDQILDGLIEANLGDQVLLYEREPQCKTCKLADERVGVANGGEILERLDKWLLRGCKVPTVRRRLADLAMENRWPKDKLPSASSIDRHSKNHLGFEEQRGRIYLEWAAAKKGIQIYDDDDHTIISSLAFASLMAEVAWEALVEGSLTPSLAQGFQATQIVENMLEEMDATTDERTLKLEFLIAMQEYQKYIPEAELKGVNQRIREEITRQLRRPPVVEAVALPSSTK